MGSGSNLGEWVPWNIAIGDFTGDGMMDVLVLIAPYAPVDTESVMIVLEQAADRTFVPKGCWMDRRPVDVVAGDFDGDTRTEAIIVAAPYDNRYRR